MDSRPLNAIPDYNNLDLSGEARWAAERMESRAQEPASEAMFRELIAPLVSSETRNVLDIGCGTAGLARRIAAFAPAARVFATDKSAGMLQVAKVLAENEGLPNIAIEPWDVLHEEAFPAKETAFDLIVSSVMIPYLEESQVEDLIARLAGRLRPGGVLAFLEQDWLSDSVNDPSGLFPKIMEKDNRPVFLKRSYGGLRPIMRDAGLELLERRSFLWTDDHYGAYTRELLPRAADAATSKGSITAEDAARFKESLSQSAASGDFYYSILYHRVAGRKT